MPFRRSSDEEPLAGPACMHLRSKGMYMTGKMTPTREVDGVGDGYCWCNRTQKQQGPDSEWVERISSVAGRECFETVF